MQLIGGAAGVVAVAPLHPQVATAADTAVVPHEGTLGADDPVAVPGRGLRLDQASRLDSSEGLS
jgi:hypothetical protein